MQLKTQGIIFIFFASVAWALESVLSRFANAGGTPIKTAAFALFFGGLTALAYAVFKKERLTLTKPEWKGIAIIIFCGTILAQPLYYWGLSKTALVNGVLISHTQPIFVIIFGYFLLKEKLRISDYLGGALVLFAAVLVTSREIHNIAGFRFGSSGDILILGTTVMWALAIFPAKKWLGNTPASVVTAFRFGIASLFLLSYVFATSNLRIDNVFQVIIGIVIGIGAICYYEGVKRIKAAQVALFELAAPFIVAVLGFYFFSETLTLLQILAFPLLGAGLWLIARRESV